MRLMLFAVLFLFLALNVFAAKPIALEGGFEVLVVDDVPGRDMGAELFEGGPLTAEQRLAFMPGGKAPAAVNAFVVKAGGKTYLIDAGFGNAVKDKRIDPSKIDVVLITHAHGDHIGGLLKEDGTANFSAPMLISKAESNYWLDARTPNSDLPKSVARVYGNRYSTFAFGDTLAPGIVAIDAAGHTPGHTAFLIGTGKRKLLIAADFLHAAVLQFQNPEECASFDMDRKKSVEARKRLIQMSVDNGWLIGGMHIRGGVGSVRSNGKGGFEFTPWQR